MSSAYIRSGAIFCIALISAVDRASAGYVQWLPENGGNGHYYGLVIPTSPAESFTWTEARGAAAGTTFLGSLGHLATVNSAAEDEFLRQQFADRLFDNFPVPTDRIYAWIGLFAPTPTSPFQWVTGEAVTYTNWAPSEPNFFGEDLWQYAHYWTRDFGNGPSWTWNNEKNDGFNPPLNTYGYIVEFEGPFQATPEPTSLTLASLGAIGLICRYPRRSRRRSVSREVSH